MIDFAILSAATNLPCFNSFFMPSIFFGDTRDFITQYDKNPTATKRTAITIIETILSSDILYNEYICILLLKW